MTKEEFETLYQEDSEVKKYIDALGDKRVNQARETWTKRLPEEAEKLAIGILERKERENDFRAEIGNKLTGEGIPVEVGFKLMGEIGVDTDKDVLESKFSKAVEQFNEIKISVAKERFGNMKTPLASKIEAELVKPIQEASSKEILDNLDKYNQVRN